MSSSVGGVYRQLPMLLGERSYRKKFSFRSFRCRVSGGWWSDDCRKVLWDCFCPPGYMSARSALSPDKERSRWPRGQSPHQQSSLLQHGMTFDNGRRLPSESPSQRKHNIYPLSGNLHRLHWGRSNGPFPDFITALGPIMVNF